MSNQPASQILFGAFKSLIISILKIALLALAWAAKLVGLILTKFSEVILKLLSR